MQQGLNRSFMGDFWRQYRSRSSIKSYRQPRSMEESRADGTFRVLRDRSSVSKGEGKASSSVWPTIRGRGRLSRNSGRNSFSRRVLPWSDSCFGKCSFDSVGNGQTLENDVTWSENENAGNIDTLHRISIFLSFFVHFSLRESFFVKGQEASLLRALFIGPSEYLNGIK